MEEIQIPIGPKKESLSGMLEIPKSAISIVIFAHGSGSSRFSVRNQHVAKEFQKNGIATLLFDLLTTDEEVMDEVTAELRFNIPLLAKRLVEVTRYIMKKHPNLSIGFFGASTGAAAALVAAAELGTSIRAVVSRGGRPDLAKESLSRVVSPTLLLVGGFDTEVIYLNELAEKSLACPKKLQIIAGATHLFEEKGKLDEVTQAALDWFKNYFYKTE